MQRMLSPLIASVMNLGAIAVTQELVARGANVNQTIPDLLQAPLHHACHRNNAEAIKVLLAHGADLYALDYMERSTLHWAAIGCAAATMRKLMRITQCFFLNAVDTNGYTPVMLAAEHGRADVVELLIECGADCTLKNKLNHNATELADWFGHRKAVELLVDATSGASRATSTA
jgi:ankyrin repeat protein